MATSSTETLNSRLFCSECGRSFPLEDLARFGANVVCADCKPRFVQRMREGAATSSAVQYGGFWRRVLAVLIDGVILMIVTFPVQMAIGMFLAPSIGRARSLALGTIGTSWLFSTALNVTYYAYFLSQKSATPGKMVMGLKVITATGGRISVARAIARYFAQFLGAVILCIGYIMVAFDSQKRALHDHICSTRVIREA